MNDYLKKYLKEYIALVDEEMYDELYSNCSNWDRAELTEFLLSCNIKPDEYMKSLPEYYLAKSNVHSYHISSTINVIGGGAFLDCPELKSIYIPESVTNIKDYAFYHCTELTSAIIGNGVTSIGRAVFEECTALTSITIPDSVISIGVSAFEGCSSLTSITIPNSITSIECGSFRNCSRLNTISYKGTVEEWKHIDISPWSFDNVLTSIVRCTDGITRTL